MAKKEKRLGARILVFAIVLVIVTLLVLFGTKLAGGSLRRIVYMIGSGVSGSAEETTIQFDSNSANRFHAFSGGFAVLSADGMHIYSMSGKEKGFTALSYHSPSIAGSKKTVAAYDRNGQSFTILNEKKILLQQQTDAPIIALSMNRAGAFSTITAGPDCRTRVIAYSSSFQELYKLHSAEQYIIAAPISEDTKRMATLSFSASGGQFSGQIGFYRLDQEEPVATVALSDCTPLSALFESNGELTVLCEDRLLRFSPDGEQRFEQRFDGLSIANASLAPGGSSVLLDTYQVGGDGKLLLISNSGAVQTLPMTEEVLSVSSAGGYTALTFSDRIVVYRADGSEYHTFQLAQGARFCLMRDDGTVFAIGANYATLLIP